MLTAIETAFCKRIRECEYSGRKKFVIFLVDVVVYATKLSKLRRVEQCLDSMDVEYESKLRTCEHAKQVLDQMEAARCEEIEGDPQEKIAEEFWLLNYHHFIARAFITINQSSATPTPFYMYRLQLIFASVFKDDKLSSFVHPILDFVEIVKEEHVFKESLYTSKANFVGQLRAFLALFHFAEKRALRTAAKLTSKKLETELHYLDPAQLRTVLDLYEAKAVPSFNVFLEQREPAHPRHVWPGPVEIDKSEREDVWNAQYGKDVRKGKCPVCDRREITLTNFRASHIVAKARGDNDDNLSNLKPTCAACNYSMGTSNLDDFRAKYYAPKKVERRSSPTAQN